jgi:hypothetical protein
MDKVEKPSNPECHTPSSEPLSKVVPLTVSHEEGKRYSFRNTMFLEYGTTDNAQKPSNPMKIRTGKWIRARYMKSTAGSGHVAQTNTSCTAVLTLLTLFTQFKDKGS